MSRNIINQLKMKEKKSSSAAEKLSSGLKINQAADNASGLAISEKMRGQIRGLIEASNNIQDGVSYVQTADGALGDITEILQRIRTLSVQSSNDTNTDDDRKNIDAEVQQLKTQVDDIFGNTEFNKRKIWDLNSTDKMQIGTIPKQAVTMNSPYYQYYTITDTNKGAVPNYPGYTISVVGTDPNTSSTYGLKVSWKGYNGNNYSTNLINWNNVTGTNPSFDLADYVDTATYPELAGINYKVSYQVEETATLADIADSLNGVVISTSIQTSQSIVNSNANGDISMGVKIYYLAELASNQTMEAYDTTFIQPNISGSSNVTIPDYTLDPEDSTGIGFDFTMPNIGNVTANCDDIEYYSNDTSDAVENKWWQYVNNGATQYKSIIGYAPPVSGTGLNSILSCVETNDGHSITKDATGSGYIILRYSLKSDSAYSYGGNNSNQVGSMTFTISVSDNDTKDDIINKLNSNFNSTSIVDVFEGNSSTLQPSPATTTVYGATAKEHIIDVPVYKTINDLKIQSGANTNQIINITYDNLRTKDIGINNVNTLTQGTSSDAISVLDGAIKIVSKQRSTFGAYQNRFQYANDNAQNSSENLQSAESCIRDVDMAKEMLEYSKVNILEQAGLSILSQDIKSSQSILNILKA